MNRSLKWSVLMALALGSSQVMAQGSGQAGALDLGQIQVKSALGQPLLAEIPVHSSHPADLHNLKVQLASGEDFARAGIAGGRTTLPLEFKVVDLGNGRQVIRITSSTAVDDPYLDLLLQVDGAAGKSVREYTLLLDPPGSVAGAPAYTQAPAPATRAAPVHRAAPAAAAPAATPAPRANAAVNGNYGPVQRGQTLSTIARSAVPDADVHQVMLAFKRANPDAFYRDNINALKSGEVLRVPTREEIQSTERAAAVAEVRRENSDWRATAASTPTTVADAATRASTSSAPAASQASSTDRLALVPASAGKSSSGTDDKASAALKQDLLRSQESIASLQQQSGDLKDQLKELADINSKNKRLLTLKDNQIAELQAKLAAAGQPVDGAPKSAAVVAAPAVATTTSAASKAERAALALAGTAAAKPTPAPVAAASMATTTTTTTAMTAPAKAEAPATAKPAAQHPAPKPASKAAEVEQPWYMQQVAWLAAGGVVVLLLLLALLGRRKKAVKLPAAAASSSLADRFAATPTDEYGGDDVDQNELLDQLAEHPDDVSLHLELVSLYYSRRDVEHFEAAAEAMHAHIVDPQQEEWQDVVHMGEDLSPGHPLFAAHDDMPADDETQLRPAFDIDHYGEETEFAPVAPVAPASPKKVSEYNFNFQLSPTPASSESPYTEAPPADEFASFHSEDDILPPSPTAEFEPLDIGEPAADEPVSTWKFDDDEVAAPAESFDHDAGAEPGEFSDDPVDTKLDLARAYMDMGDADGARAMLDEVLREGTQMQRDVAQRLSDSLG
ncbi:MAG TPA: FimV/HubP family polar landmark protein [Rhodanobacter sp.]|nr:FimV/HubP family polar landmark protein [Rhodanobacter sp.]